MPLTAGTRHKLVVRTDWRGPAAMKADGWHRLWFNYGGINRGVSIRRIGPSEISVPEMQTKLVDGAAVVDLEIHLRNNIDARALGAKGTLSRGDRSIPFEFPAEPLAKSGTEVLQTQVRVTNPDLWSPSAPNLWDLELEVPGESTYRARVGLREVRAEGADLLLNGKPIKLRGASIHEDVFGRGDGLRPIDQDRMIGHLKAIDANATRSQHPLDPGLLERLDAAGIMVWQGVGPTDAPGNFDLARREARARREGARPRERAPRPAQPVDHHVEPRQRGRRQGPRRGPDRRTSTAWPPSSNAPIPAGRSRWTSGARTRRGSRRGSTATST